jgi:hypothetical protein
LPTAPCCSKRLLGHDTKFAKDKTDGRRGINA